MNEMMKEFRMLCREYRKEKQWLEELCSDVLTDSHLTPRVSAQISFLMQDVHRVEDVLKRIEEKHGSRAARIVRQVYVENTKVADAAAMFCMSKRSLERHLNRWVREGVTDHDRL